MWQTLKLTGIGLLLGGLVMFGWMNIRHTRQTEVQVSTIITELQKVNRLETIIYKTEQIIEAQKSSDSVWRDLLFGDKILLIAHGEVVAGIDLSQLEADDIRVEGKTVSITLPAPEIFSTFLDEDRTRVYDRTTGLLNAGDINLETEARQAANTELTTAACENNVLEQANHNAQVQVRALLNALDFEDVEVYTTPGSC